MKISVDWKGGMCLEGHNSEQKKTVFDSHSSENYVSKAATPMEIMLQSMAACSMMDVLSILEKKRKNITSLHVEVIGDRADEHPKVFTSVLLKFYLKSTDAELKDIERSVELSQQTYCSAAAMFKRSGCEVKTECYLDIL
jgi:putative redox protein